MRQPSHLFRSFAGGEMSPEMYARLDDSRFVNGAALVRNMICRPQGAVIRRPGFQFVRKVRDSSLGPVRLLPFIFASGDTFAIETGRATVDSREIGYFRFHTDGGTLLFDTPPAYVAPQTVSSFSGTTVDFGLVAHGFKTGDPVVMTIFAKSSGTPVGANIGTVNITTNRWTYVGASTVLGHGDEIVIDAATMPFTKQAGALERGRRYFVHHPDPLANPNAFGIALTRFGEQLDFTSPGTAAYASSVPNRLMTNVVKFVRYISATTFKVADTKAKALSNDVISFGSTNGFGDRRFHYAYKPGDLIYWPGVGPGSFASIRTPWGTEGSNYVYESDHIDHAPPAFTNYWCRSAGLNGTTDTRGRSFTVTCDPAADTIDIGVTHGLDEGEPVIIHFVGSPAPGISDGDVLYVRNALASSTAFQVSATPFGETIDLTSAGASVTLLCAPYYDVPHYYSADDLPRLNVAQSNDVLTIACANKPAAELRRLSASRWERVDIRFGASVPAPSDMRCSMSDSVVPLPRGVQGQSFEVTVGLSGPPARLDTLTNHVFADNELVYVFGLEDKSIDDGDYMIHEQTAPNTSEIYLVEVDTGRAVGAVGTGGTGYVQPALSAVDILNRYVITSIGSDGVESEASAEFQVENNLNVAGAYNPLAWTAVPGASRYRIYKNTTGLFGLIGEAEDTSFIDDNIAPDLSIAPPIADKSLLIEGNILAWNLATATITWDGDDLLDGMPIVFQTNDTLPTAIVEGTTYYVYNYGDGAFQVTASPTSTTPVSLGGTTAGQWQAKSGNFPGTVSYFEGRRCFSGSLVLSQDVWMTASGTEQDLSYSLPTVDSDRIQFRIAMREAAQVRHIVPMSHLLLMTSSSELRLTPVNDDVVTPTSISIRPQSYVGADYPQPVIVNNVVVFAAARGGHLRELGFQQESNSYLSGDLSLRAMHLFDDYTLTQLAYQKAPIPTVWSVSSNGKLLGMTYMPDEQVGSWHQHDTTGGTFESVVALPEGTEDVLYVSTLRNGARYIERSARQRVTTIEDAFYVDAGITYQGSATTTIRLPPHLAGRTVNFIADGITGSGTVTAGGVLTLPTAASKVHVGEPITSQLQTIPLGLQVDASFGTGRPKNVSAVWARIYESGQFQVGPDASRLVPSKAPAAGQLLSELLPVTLRGTWTSDGQVLFQTATAAPLTLVGITIEIAVGG